MEALLIEDCRPNHCSGNSKEGNYDKDLDERDSGATAKRRHRHPMVAE